MTAFLLRFLEATIRMLPAALARSLLVVVILGAALLHYMASGRISALERSQDTLKVQNSHVLITVTELRDEIRGYRQDIREENKALKLKRLAP